MQVIRSPADTANIADAAIRQMILQRIESIASEEPYDATLYGYFLVLEDDDTLAAIAAQIGFDPLTKTPEILEEYPDCYDLLFIVDDSGYGIELFIPKSSGSPELIAMSKRLAVPGTL